MLKRLCAVRFWSDLPVPLLAILCSINLSGCAAQLLGNPNCVKAALAYSGDIKPFGDVGVVVFDRYATAVQVDGQYKHKLRTISASCGVVQGWDLDEQIHLEPGVHVLQLAYSVGTDGPFTRNWTPYVVLVSAGDVFQIKSVVNEKRTHVSFVGNLVPGQKEAISKRFGEILSENSLNF